MKSPKRQQLHEKLLATLVLSNLDDGWWYNRAAAAAAVCNYTLKVQGGCGSSLKHNTVSETNPTQCSNLAHSQTRRALLCFTYRSYSQRAGRTGGGIIGSSQIVYGVDLLRNSFVSTSSLWIGAPDSNARLRTFSHSLMRDSFICCIVLYS